MNDLESHRIAEFVRQQVGWFHLAEQLGLQPGVLTGRLTELFSSTADRGDAVVHDGGAICGILTRSSNPWTGADEGYLYAISPREPAQAVERLTRSALRMSAEQGLRLWRAETVSDTPGAIAAALSERGWVRHYEVTAMRLPARELTACTTDTCIEPAAPADWSFVADLLFQAVWDGLDATERAGRDPDEIRRAVADEYERGVRDGSTFSFIGTDPERRLGHATARLVGPHPVLGLIESELVDTFTLPAATGRGVGMALTAAALRELSGRGAEIVFGTLDLLHTPAQRVGRLRRQLEDAGWWTFSTFWLLLP